MLIEAAGNRPKRPPLFSAPAGRREPLRPPLPAGREAAPDPLQKAREPAGVRSPPQTGPVKACSRPASPGALEQLPRPSPRRRPSAGAAPGLPSAPRPAPPAPLAPPAGSPAAGELGEANGKGEAAAREGPVPVPTTGGGVPRPGPAALSSWVRRARRLRHGCGGEAWGPPREPPGAAGGATGDRLLLLCAGGCRRPGAGGVGGSVRGPGRAGLSGAGTGSGRGAAG